MAGAGDVRKYNPGFLADDELVESFCVRTSEFESIAETLRESTGNANPHVLVIGPRGSGKTYLLFRVAAEIRQASELAGFFPIVFGEENYEVTTCGEFWLECLRHLSEQAPSYESASLRLACEDFGTISDDSVLATRCLGRLLDFADRRGQRLVMMIENLNMLFADMDDPDVGWQLRKTLQTEPRIMLLGSATSRFSEIDHQDRALYDLFRVITLHPLDIGECKVLWQAVSGKSSASWPVRPLQILAGGNPRLLSVVAGFGADHSFYNLMADLFRLVDDHTEYFKSHLEALPPQERRVYLALAKLWKPATTKEISDLARIGTSKCSAQLRRLIARGVVAIAGGTGWRREYYLAERLYNIYYLLRRRSGPYRMVEALIQFMASYYGLSDLMRIGRGIKLVDEDINRVFGSDVVPEMAGPMFMEMVAEKMLKKALASARNGFLFHRAGRFDEALGVYDVVLERFGSCRDRLIENLMNLVRYNKGVLLIQTRRFEEALGCHAGILQRSDVAGLAPKTYLHTGIAFLMLDRKKEAVRAFDEVLRRCDTNGTFDEDLTVLGALVYKSFLLLDSEAEKAVEGFDRAIGQFREEVRRFNAPDQDASGRRMSRLAGFMAEVLVGKGIVLAQSGKAVSEEEVEILLACLAASDVPPDGSVEVLVRFVVYAGPARALDLIGKAPETVREETLLPLVTALRRELGQASRVAREVEEIATDIRQRLVEPGILGDSAVFEGKGIFQTGPNVVLRTEEPFPPVRSVIARNGDLETKYPVKENPGGA